MNAATPLGGLTSRSPSRSLAHRRVRCAVLLDGCPPHVSDGSGGVDGTDTNGSPGDATGTRTLVVLDDACERLERVASDGMGRGPIGAWQRRALLRSLRAAEPAAGPAAGDALELLPLGRNATREARACLVRTRATPAATASLEALAVDGARLVSVTTVARLLARAYRRHPVPRLFVASTPADERHVLVVDGVACFSRTVARPEASDAERSPAAERTAAAVAESLEHLAGRYAAGVVDVGGIGLDDAALDACRGLERVGEVRRVSRTDLATTLVRRLAERAGPVGARRRAAHVPALLDGAAAIGRVDGARRGRIPLIVAALASCLAIATVGRALATHVRLDGAAASIASDRAALEAALAAELAALNAAHERPFEAAASLERAESLVDGAPPAPEALLTLVATALREHDALRIDSIAWSMSAPTSASAPPSEDRAAGGTFEGAGGDVVFAGAASLPVRTADPLAERAPGLDAELSGRVVRAEGVGAAERAVNGFAAALGANADVGPVLGLDSPLERVAGGATVGTDGPSDAVPDASDDGSTWRLRFVLGGRRLEP